MRSKDRLRTRETRVYVTTDGEEYEDYDTAVQRQEKIDGDKLKTGIFDTVNGMINWKLCDGKEDELVLDFPKIHIKTFVECPGFSSFVVNVTFHKDSRKFYSLGEADMYILNGLRRMLQPYFDKLKEKEDLIASSED